MIFLIVLIIPVLGVVGFLRQPMFGKKPVGERLEAIKKSIHFLEGKFQNLSFTPDLAEGATFYTVLKEFIFDKSKRSKPAGTLPSKKTDLHALAPGQNVLVWFGHSSYFMQVDGRRILVDPVFSGAASPISATTKSFAGSDVYTVADMPEIDYLFISHDHWDHLDYKTVKALRPTVKKVICGLGVGDHLRYWGFENARIIEKDWGDEIMLENNFIVTIAPARHFSGRSFKRNGTLWSSFIFKTPSMKLFIGGDSGYDTHFKEIGEQHGPFDLAILECGQYNKSWKYIHMMPEETIRAAQDLKATKLMPVHWGKFSLALHAWNEPVKAVTALAKINNLPLLTPMIGEAVDLKNPGAFIDWWDEVG